MDQLKKKIRFLVTFSYVTRSTELSTTDGLNSILNRVEIVYVC